MSPWRDLAGALFYTLAAFGVAYVLGGSEIFLPVRRLLARLERQPMKSVGALTHRTWIAPRPVRFVARWLLKLIECPACVGFWTGVFAFYLLDLDLPHYGQAWSSNTQAAAFGLATCVTNMILARVVEL